MQKRRFVTLVGVLLLSILTGCSTLPSTDAMKAEIATFQLPMQPAAGKALVYVVRPSGPGGLIRFNVFVNDQEAASEMGYTRGSQYIYFQVPPGEHTIYSKAENWAETKIVAKAGDIIYLQQLPSMGFIMARNDIIGIEETPGKYHVKKLDLGTIIKLEK